MEFRLEFDLQISREAPEARLLSKLEEKDDIFFTGADATLELLESFEDCRELKELTAGLLKER